MAEYFTEEQLKELKEKLKYLETVKTKEIAKLISEAASYGDLSENAAYTEAKEKQAFLQGEISELREKIRGAKIIKKEKTGKIQVGSKVLVDFKGEKVKFEIVGSSQSDPLEGKISSGSPVGQALLGKSIGDTIKIETDGGGETIYKILKVE